MDQEELLSEVCKFYTPLKIEGKLVWRNKRTGKLIEAKEND